MRERIQIEAKKAYLASETVKLDRLLKEESRWKRKVTISTNKLADVRAEINILAAAFAGKLDGGQAK